MDPLVRLATPARSGIASATVRASVTVSAVALLSVSLGGCGMSSLTSGLGSSMFGGSSTTATAEAPKVSEEQLLTAAKSPEAALPGTTGGIEVAAGCPKVIANTRDSNLTIYEPGRVGDGLAIVHRGEITKTARECTIEGSRVTVKYGFSGRILLGPRGKPGIINLPVNVAVADAKREKVATDKMKVDTAVAVENPIGYFSAVRTITFDVPEGARPGEYQVDVSFDRTTPNSG